MTADVHSLAGAYALNALPDDERAFFERHLAMCDACRLEVDELTETAAYLGTAAAQQPPAELRDRILAAVDVTRQLAPESDATPVAAAAPRRQRVRWLAPIAAALAVAVVALGGLAADLNRRLNTGPATDAMTVLAADDLSVVDLDGEVSGRFMFSASADKGMFIADDVAAVGADQTYELWLIHDGTPVPAGLFQPDERGAAIAAVEGIVRGAEVVAVTVEPRGGSARPTGSVIASAEL